MTRVKICGLTRPEDADQAAELGAWALGFILWPSSPRAADPAVVAGMAARHRRRALCTGVFVDPTLDEVAHAVEGLGLGAVQLHGSVGTAFCDAVHRRTAVPVIRAFPVASRADVQRADAFREVAYHLYDTRTVGGTGEHWDWDLARDRRSRVPLVLSGGLTAETVAEGIAAVRPHAVDVASGTEASPGVKDPAKVEAFFAAAGAHAAEAAA